MALNEVEVGQQVILTIGSVDDIEGDYSGNVAFINRDRTRIHLQDTVFCQTEKKFSGVKQFYLPEVLSVKIISDVDASKLEPALNSIELVDQLKFELSEKENEAIEKLIRNRRIIGSAGNELDEALYDIFHYQFVGLSADAVGSGDREAITFIVCSTPHTIYVFNLRAIGAVNDRFKEWFESDAYTKVIPGAKSVTEKLNCLGIDLNGTFDTMDVHGKLPHIGLSPEVAEKLDCVQENKIESAVTRIAVLLKFHAFLTEQLLTDAYESFQRNLDYCRNKDSVEVQAIYRAQNQSIVYLNG